MKISFAIIFLPNSSKSFCSSVLLTCFRRGQKLSPLRSKLFSASVKFFSVRITSLLLFISSTFRLFLNLESLFLIFIRYCLMFFPCFTFCLISPIFSFFCGFFFLSLKILLLSLILEGHFSSVFCEVLEI